MESDLERRAVERVRNFFDPSQGLPSDLARFGLPSFEPGPAPRPLEPYGPEPRPPEPPRPGPRLPRIAPVFPDALKVALAYLCQAILEEDGPGLERATDEAAGVLCGLFGGGVATPEALLRALDSASPGVRRVFYDSAGPLPHARWLSSGGTPTLEILAGWLERAEGFYSAPLLWELEGAERLLEAGDARGARRLFSRVLQIGVDGELQARAWLGRGCARLAAGSPGSARRDLSRALRVLAGVPTTELVRAYFWRGRAQARSGQLPQALSDFGRAVETAQRCGAAVDEILRERSALALRLRHYPEAVDDAGRLLELCGDSAELRVLRGRALERLGRPREAARDYERAAELARNPRQRERLRRRAAALREDSSTERTEP